MRSLRNRRITGNNSDATQPYQAVPAITSLQAGFGTNASAILRLESDTVTRFELTDSLHGEVRDAYDGVAMALTLDSPSIPSGARFAILG